MKYWLTQWKDGFLCGSIFAVMLAIAGQLACFFYQQNEIKKIECVLREIRCRQDIKDIGSALICPVNAKERGYKPFWYQLQKGECCVSKDWRDAGILQKGDFIEIAGMGKYRVASYSGVKEKRVIKVWTEFSLCNSGARRARVYLLGDKK